MNARPQGDQKSSAHRMSNIMSGKTSILDYMLATPTLGDNDVTVSIRSSLVSSLFENVRPVFMAGAASAFVAFVVFVRLHVVWAALWLVTDIAILTARLSIVH